MPQLKQAEWNQQWSMFKDEAAFLFEEWIAPCTLEDFRGKEVLEAGCGRGQHTALIAPIAQSITAVDLNTAALAKAQNAGLANARFIEADIVSMDLGRKFDVVFSVGVVHHTDDPDKAAANLVRHLRPGGMLILWVYAKEGNGLVQYAVEPMRKLVFRHLPKSALRAVAAAITFLLYVPVYSLYLLPFKFLPYYAYFGNFRRLSFARNTLNVFDKLNAPQVQFIGRARVEAWFRDFTRVHVEAYKGVSWRAHGTKIS